MNYDVSYNYIQEDKRTALLKKQKQIIRHEKTTIKQFLLVLVKLVCSWEERHLVSLCVTHRLCECPPIP